MNYEIFIARRIAFSGKKSFLVAGPIIRIALAGVALGFAVMIIAVAIVSGFKKEISDKVIGFSTHIQVSNFDENNSYETKPVDANPELINHLKNIPGVAHVQTFATKAGIVKVNDQIEGVVAKGVENNFDWTFLKNHLVSGSILHFSDTSKSEDVLISMLFAKKLKLKTGDDLPMYFIQQPPRARKFKIGGIYETDLEEFDNLYLFCDLRQIQKLNDWKENQVGGYEINVKDFSKVDDIALEVYDAVGSGLNARTVKEIYPQIFAWLGLQNINAIIIITLMIIVAGMNMISALLIIILERVNMIGTLKSLGSENFSVRKIFVYLAAFLIGRGLLWGNAIGIIFCLLQKYFGIFHLDQESYYLSNVPINLSLVHILLLNIGTMLVCIIMMILPTYLITKVQPHQALRYS